MRVLIDMEIETADYGGKEFKEEIEKLIQDIDPNTRLVLFKMRAKGIHINEALYQKCHLFQKSPSCIKSVAALLQKSGTFAPQPLINTQQIPPYIGVCYEI